MHRNRQNGQLHALQRESGHLQRRSIEIMVAVRHSSAIHLSVIEQKTVPGTVFSTHCVWADVVYLSLSNSRQFSQEYSRQSLCLIGWLTVQRL